MLCFNIYRRRTRPPQRKSTTRPTPYPRQATTVITHTQDSPYANYGRAKVSRRPVWAQWFIHRSTQHLHYPPPLPPADCPEDNTLFVLVNTDIETDIRLRRPPEVVGMPPKLWQCLTVWIWKANLREWQSIQYGDVQLIEGEELALDLGGKSGIEPCWVLYKSLTKKGYKKSNMKQSCVDN